MSSAQNIIRYLEDNSLTILNEAVADVRANSGQALRGISNEDLQVALYTALLKTIDTLRDRFAGTSEVRIDTKALFLNSIKDLRLGFTVPDMRQVRVMKKFPRP